MIRSRDGIVVIRPANALEICKATQEKNRKEDQAFSMMDENIILYEAAHLKSTASLWQIKMSAS